MLATLLTSNHSAVTLLISYGSFIIAIYFYASDTTDTALLLPSNQLAASLLPFVPMAVMFLISSRVAVTLLRSNHIAASLLPYVPLLVTLLTFNHISASLFPYIPMEASLLPSIHMAATLLTSHHILAALMIISRLRSSTVHSDSSTQGCNHKTNQNKKPYQKPLETSQSTFITQTKLQWMCETSGISKFRFKMKYFFCPCLQMIGSYYL